LTTGGTLDPPKAKSPHVVPNVPLSPFTPVKTLKELLAPKQQAGRFPGSTLKNPLFLLAQLSHPPRRLRDQVCHARWTCLPNSGLETRGKVGHRCC
jgi:hypothetical protein